MDKRVDVLLKSGKRIRGTVTVSQDGTTLTIGGLSMMPTDHAMIGAQIIASDPDVLRGVSAAGFQAVQAGNITVAAKLPRDMGEAMKQACQTHGLTMSAAITEAVQMWLEADCPRSHRENANNMGSGQRG